MRVAVLPRRESASIITSSLARSFAAINAVSLTFAIPMLLEYLLSRGLAGSVAAPLSILVVLAGLSIAAAIRPRRSLVAVFLVLGTVGAVAFQLLLLAASPTVLEDALYLANRPAVALVLVGTTAATIRAGVLWTLVGFAASNLVTAIVAIVGSVPFTPGFGPSLVLLTTSTAYLALALIQRSLRRRVPDFDAIESQIRRDLLDENLSNRVTTAVHDTLLNDLSIVMNAPDRLEERVASRLRQDVATLTSAEWLEQSAEVLTDAEDSELRNRVIELISELQWRGLTVHVTGSGTGIVRLPHGGADAIIDAVRACLENVLRHSGVTVAEIDLAYTDDAVTIVVSDNGVGFDPASIPDDRLGVRESVIERIRSIGGTARVWSTPGQGTSVVLTVPGERVTAHEESDHARR